MCVCVVFVIVATYIKELIIIPPPHPIEIAGPGGARPPARAPARRARNGFAAVTPYKCRRRALDWSTLVACLLSPSPLPRAGPVPHCHA